jgi:hypothetical protein
VLRCGAMKIRYGGRAATISLALGLVAIAWTPVAASVELRAPTLVFGPLTLLGAVALLGALLMKSGRTYVTIDNAEVVIHALVGPLKRRFPFESWRDVQLANGVLTIAGSRVPMHRTQANDDDWHELERFVEARTVGNEAP